MKTASALKSAAISTIASLALLFIESTDVAEVHLLEAGADLLAKSPASALLSE